MIVLELTVLEFPCTIVSVGRELKEGRDVVVVVLQVITVMVQFLLKMLHAAFNVLQDNLSRQRVVQV